MKTAECDSEEVNTEAISLMRGQLYLNKYIPSYRVSYQCQFQRERHNYACTIT